MIHRTEHEDNFTIIANDTIRNPDLSDGAKVLLLYMLTCSDDWNFSIKGLAYVFGVAERTIMLRITELKKAGYVRQRRIQNSKGVFEGCVWDIYEDPSIHSAIKPQCGSNHSVEQSTVWSNPQCGEIAPIRNTNSKEIPNIKEIPKEKKDIFRKPTFEEVQAYCLERNNGIDPEQFIDYYESKGWVVGKSKMKDWKACVRTWERNRKGKPTAIKPNPVPEESPFKKLLREEGYSI